jgi:hypothetical protein
MSKQSETKKEKKTSGKGMINFLKKLNLVKEKEVLKPEESDTSLEEGINLIPKLTEEEMKHEEKKAILNVSSAFSFLSLVVISVFVVSFNIFSKIEVNNKRSELTNYETVIKRSIQTIIDNNDIVDRVYLYQDIEEQTFSPKEVIDYIETIAEKSGGINIDAYDIGDELDFEFSGSSTDLEKVSKFWYLLCSDKSIEIVNLDSISKTNSGTNFSFSGKLIYEDFVNSSDEN